MTKNFYYYNIIYLQCSVSFCCTTKWIVCVCVCVCTYPLLESPSHLIPPSYPSRSWQSINLSSPCYIAASPLAIYLHMVVYICQCYSLSVSHPLLPPMCPQVCSLYLHLYSCPTNRFICSIFRTSQVVLVVKNLYANAGDIRDLGSVPWLGRSPGVGNDTPPQHSCLDKPMDRGAWRATVPGPRTVKHDWSYFTHM